ncbi:4'-phosphopantetheinyl transferase family protein [Vibrio nigripulchritudo]|uniref:4'-phosphopantetheinyl transferase family protein n=1 Tax=Vibrio nigripulchritudo TaxID=28173 RepID=UPI0005F9CB8A|nr:4'-phosphopantetheinyl transferase superfamily protein [Vibrio nigripulchritudo]KJY78338.1 phosphopantetheinyl transferase [Vibrio nigripulchritudo]
MSFLAELQIRTLGPVKIWQRQFDVSQYLDSHSSELAIELPQEMNRAVPKRKAEFTAGRVVAREALQDLGVTHTKLPIGEHRAPIWPKGYLGSISHTDNLALATVARDSEVSMLGLDVENLIDESQVQTLMPMFVSDAEMDWQQTSGLTPQQFATLIFSAKESAFKAIYPYVKNYLEFSDSILRNVDVESGTLQLQLCNQAEKLFGEPLILKVYFTFEAESVFTLICDHRKHRLI